MTMMMDTKKAEIFMDSERMMLLAKFSSLLYADRLRICMELSLDLDEGLMCCSSKDVISKEIFDQAIREGEEERLSQKIQEVYLADN